MMNKINAYICLVLKYLNVQIQRGDVCVAEGG